jgi:hypothetical protein
MRNHSQCLTRPMTRPRPPNRVPERPMVTTARSSRIQPRLSAVAEQKIIKHQVGIYWELSAVAPPLFSGTKLLNSSNLIAVERSGARSVHNRRLLIQRNTEMGLVSKMMEERALRYSGKKRRVRQRIVLRVWLRTFFQHGAPCARMRVCLVQLPRSSPLRPPSPCPFPLTIFNPPHAQSVSSAQRRFMASSPRCQRTGRCRAAHSALPCLQLIAWPFDPLGPLRLKVIQLWGFGYADCAFSPAM